MFWKRNKKKKESEVKLILLSKVNCLQTTVEDLRTNIKDCKYYYDERFDYLNEILRYLTDSCNYKITNNFSLLTTDEETIKNYELVKEINGRKLWKKRKGERKCSSKK